MSFLYAHIDWAGTFDSHKKYLKLINSGIILTFFSFNAATTAGRRSIWAAKRWFFLDAWACCRLSSSPATDCPCPVGFSCRSTVNLRRDQSGGHWWVITSSEGIWWPEDEELALLWTGCVGSFLSPQSHSCILSPLMHLVCLHMQPSRCHPLCT